VQGLFLSANRALVAVFSLLGVFATAEEPTPSTTVVISVADQKLAILRDGGLVKKFPISTSKFGLGDSHGSYKTPLGKLRVCDKIGDELTAGAVLKARHATGEVLPVNAPGRDPIVTRILWLEGLEAQNENARERGIYIHGTVEESKIGEPVSYGCIRMRSKDVVDVFEEVPVDATVTIITEKLPRFRKYTVPKLQIIAAAPPPKSAPSLPAPPTTTIALPPSLPPPTLLARTSAKPTLEISTKPAQPLNATASLALKGSMLDAGLPEGPKILSSLPAPTESKDVPRFSTFTPGLAPDSAFSLQGIKRDLSPAIRAADTDAAAREATTTPPPETSKPAPWVAFRSGAAEAKPTQ
jgi:hypothetical protein